MKCSDILPGKYKVLTSDYGEIMLITLQSTRQNNMLFPTRVNSPRVYSPYITTHSEIIYIIAM